MNVSIKTALLMAGGVLLVALVFAGYMALRDRQHQAEIIALQNKVASQAKTIEVQEGLYQKEALQSKNLEKLLNDKDSELVALRDQLDKQGAQLLTANTIVVQLRKDLQDARDVKVVILDPEKPGVKSISIDSEEKLDPFRITGKVDVDCEADTAHYKVNLAQRSSIKFSVVVSQDKDGTWRSSATSSTTAFQVDIALAAVNPYMLEEKWYEKVSLGVELGIGTNPGFIAGVGADVEIGRFEVGPRVWVVLDRGVSPYFGASLTWHPFKKVR